MIHALKNRFKSIVLLIMGLVIAILTITLGISQLNQSLEIHQRSEEVKLNLSEHIMIQLSKEEDITEIVDIFAESPHPFSAQVTNAYIPIEAGLSPVLASYIHDVEGLPVPLIQGRQLKAEDFQEDDPVAVIGKSLVEQGASFYSMGEQKYRIVGVAGFDDLEVPPYSYTRQIRFDFMPKAIINCLLGEGNLQIAFLNPSPEFIEYLKRELSVHGLQHVPAPKENSISVDFASTHLAKTGAYIYAMAILNTFNISIFWINNRKKEIGIRKAFGYANVDIIWMLFQEMLLIAALSFMIAIGVQLLLSPILEGIFLIKLKITWTNLYAGLLFVLITSILSVIIPGWIAAKVEPADTIRGI